MMNDLAAAYNAGQPYFGRELVADQGDSYFVYLRSLVAAVRYFTGRDCLDILEIGSWAGASLVAWANACDKRCRLMAVDPWEPYFDHENTEQIVEMTRAAKSGDILKLFEHNIKVAGISDLVSIRKQKSESFFEEHNKVPSFDIIFIDGNHVYEHVLSDIKNSMPLVRQGGILCGDDFDKQYSEVAGKPSHIEALRKSLPFIIFDDGVGYHPGIIQAVYDVFGQHMSCFGRLWVKQKLDDRWENVTGL